MNTLYPCIVNVLINTPSDAWHRNALGLTGKSIWCLLLTNEPMTPRKIIDRTGRCRSAVYKSINKLVTHRLVEALGYGFYSGVCVDHEYLQTIAAKYGVEGAGEKRRLKHQKERESFISVKIMRQKWYWNKRHGF